MIDVAIIGTGKIGTTLGFALAHSGYSITALYDSSQASLKESRAIIGQGRIAQSPSDAALRGKLVILSLPDDKIAEEATRLAASGLSWRGRIAWHCSGLHVSELLSPLRKLGALVCSVHPVLSVPEKKSDPNAFSGIFFSIEGDPKAVESSSNIIKKIGGIPFPLPAKSKTHYHTACSIASNFLVVLMETAIELLKNTGAPPEKIKPMLISLAQGTLQNVNNLDAHSALTGPIVRGDIQTVAAHLKAVKAHPEADRIYRSLALGTLLSADHQGILRPEEISRLKALLEDK